MPTDYEKGFLAGMRYAAKEIESDLRSGRAGLGFELPKNTPKPRRKLSAWNKYVKANSKKPRFRYRNGKLNLKKMAIAFRKTPAGRKKRR
jgi:hypothetical protein